MNRTQVRQLMSHPVKTLSADMGVREAAETLHTWGITGAPVLGPEGNVVGVLSLRDLSACLAARVLHLPVLFPSLDAAGGDKDHAPALHAHLENLEDAKVSDAMTPGIHCVDPDSFIRDAVQMMRQRGIRRVFVRRGTGPVEGVITSTDVMLWAEENQAGNPERLS